MKAVSQVAALTYLILVIGIAIPSTSKIGISEGLTSGHRAHHDLLSGDRN